MVALPSVVARDGDGAVVVAAEGVRDGDGAAEALRTVGAAEGEALVVVEAASIAMRLKDGHHEWTEYAGHRAAVAGAIAELAGAFDLQAEGEDRWVVRAAAWPAVAGEVVVLAEGDVATSVGLRIYSSVTDESAWKYVMILVLSYGAAAGTATLGGMLLAMLALSVWVDILLILVVGLPLAGFVLMGTFMGLAVATAAWNTRHADRWIAGWRRRFSAALVERLAAGRTYR